MKTALLFSISMLTVNNAIAKCDCSSTPEFQKRNCNKVGEGEVLYLTLGHCRHHHDMQPMMDYWPTMDRGSWDLPVFYQLLRRGIQWAIEPMDKETSDAMAKARTAVE